MFGKPWTAFVLGAAFWAPGAAAWAQATATLPANLPVFAGTPDSRDEFQNYAPLSRYGSSQSPQPAELKWLDTLRAWDSVFAGRSDLAGNAQDGTQNVVASVVGTTFGADLQLEDSVLMGGSIGLSHQTFSSGTGNGDSNDVTATLYARQIIFTRAYVGEALGYGWHDVGTHRAALLGNISLDAKYRSHDLGGRIEGGYTFALDTIGLVSPFTALVGDSYHQPAYSEDSSSRFNFFSVSYAANSVAITHAELGARYGNSFKLESGAFLSVDAVAAWEHELDDNPFVQVSFQTLPNSSFLLRGTTPARDTALLGAGVRFQDDSGLTFGGRTDARLGVGTTILSATADVTYRW